MDAKERARPAAERRGLFAELGVPPDTPYRYVEVWSPAPGEVRARYGVVLADGGHTLEHERPLRELPGESWPAVYRFLFYGVEPTDAVVWGMYLVTHAAGLPHGPDGGPIFRSDPDGWESWGTREGLLWLRITARYGDSPLYAERRRQVDRTWDDRVRGPAHRRTKDARVRAEAGLRHLQTWEEARTRRAKDPGDGRPSVEVFLARCEEVADDMWRKEIPVDDIDVFVGYLGKPGSGSTLYAWLETYRERPGYEWLTWPNLRTRLQRNTFTDDGRTKRDKLGPRRE